MNSVLDLLWLRVPPIRYVSPPACIFEASGSGSSGPAIVIEVHPRLNVTGLRIENCMLVWDALPVECEGSCPTVFCYNVYRSDSETGAYEVFAECVNDTQFPINDDACYRVSAITSEGESDLSDAVCAQCDCEEGEPTTPENLVWEPDSSGSIFEMTTGAAGSFDLLTFPGQTQQFDTQANLCNRSHDARCLKITVTYDLNATTVEPPNNLAQFDVWSDTIPFGTLQFLSVGPASVTGGVFEAVLPLNVGSNTIFMRGKAASVPTGIVSFEGSIAVELTDCSSPPPPPTECDEEVLDWISRVEGFGSSVSQTTKDAACELMAGLKAAGLREKIKRMNVYAGDTKAACRAPFIRDLGATEDGFIAAITAGTWLYSETGAGGGLRSLGNDIIDTGIFANDPALGIENCHIGVYKTTTDGFGNRIPIGAGTTAVGVLAIVFSPVTAVNFFQHSLTGDILGVPDLVQLGHYVQSRSGALTAYRNGVSIGTNPAPTGSRSTGRIFVHNASLDGSPWPSAASNGTFACYHIGTHLTAGEITTLYGLIQAFQTALTRNV